MKKIFFDLETTGLDPEKAAIHQLVMLVEINGKVMETVDLNIKPFEGASISEKALEVGGVTMFDLENYTEEKATYKKITALLQKYVNRFDKTDKFHLVGYNNRFFDDRFLRAFFLRNGDAYFGAYFWSDSLDVMVLASQFLLRERHKMRNFKLATVAEQVGLVVEDSLLHDATYDVEVTRKVYQIVTL